MKATHIQDASHEPSECQPFRFQGDSHHVQGKTINIYGVLNNEVCKGSLTIVETLKHDILTCKCLKFSHSSYTWPLNMTSHPHQRYSYKAHMCHMLHPLSISLVWLSWRVIIPLHNVLCCSTFLGSRAIHSCDFDTKSPLVSTHLMEAR